MSIDKMNQSPNHPTLRAQRARVVPVEQYAQEQTEAWHYFGRLLRAERLSRGKTRAEVLAVMGYSPAHHDYVLTDIEEGRQEVTVDQARQLDHLLGMPAVHLMVQAGVATLTALAATGDDMPLAGRPVTPPTVTRRRRTLADVRAEAAAVLGVIGAALFAVVGLMITIADGGPRAALLVALCAAAAWISFSWPLAYIAGRAIDNRNRRG